MRRRKATAAHGSEEFNGKPSPRGSQFDEQSAESVDKTFTSDTKRKSGYANSFNVDGNDQVKESSSEEDDSIISEDRLRQLRERVRIRETAKKVEYFMYFYYVLLTFSTLSFFYCMSENGLDRAVTYYLSGGIVVLAISGILYLYASYIDNGLMTALVGMVVITALPVMGVSIFTYVWVSIFFKDSWRKMFLGFANIK